MPVDQRQERTVDRLVEHLSSPHAACLIATWFNHFSLQVAFEQRHQVKFEAFDLVEVDGKFLEKLSRAAGRSSADVVVPRLLSSTHSLRVLVIGAAPAVGAEAIAKLSSLEPSHEFVYLDGYGNLPTLDEIPKLIHAFRPDLTLVGLGPSLQNKYALIIGQTQASGAVLTVGGFIDQIAVDSYYPRWAYPLRLNWLVRIYREPHRLWKRYTVDALRATVARRSLVSWLRQLPGFDRR